MNDTEEKTSFTETEQTNCSVANVKHLSSYKMKHVQSWHYLENMMLDIVK